MKSRHAGTEGRFRAGRSRLYGPAALALAVVFVAAFTAVLFTGAVSRADGPPDLGTAFHLPFKLEQGRPAPARSSSGPRQAVTTPTPSTPITPTPPTPPTPAGTPTATVIPTLDPPALESNNAPAAPTNVNAFAVADSVIEVEWDQPAGDVDGFELQVSEDGGASWRPQASKARLTDPAGRLYNWYQQYGLQPYQTRHYRVRAGNGDNWSDWSAAVSATTFTTDTPRVSVATIDKHSLKISWRAPTAAVAITGWVLQVSAKAPEPETVTALLPLGYPGGFLVRPPRDEGYWQRDEARWTTLEDDLPAAARAYTHGGLASGDTRYYRVRAVTEPDTAPWSGRGAHGTTLGDPVPPPAPVVAPKLTVESKYHDRGPEYPMMHAFPRYEVWIEVDWTKPDSGQYQLEWSPNGKDDWTGYRVVYGIDSGFSGRGNHDIGFAETRYYRIRSEKHWGPEAWSNVVKVSTRKAPPPQLAYLNQQSNSHNQIEMSWQPPHSDRGSAISGYEIQASTKGYYKKANWSTVATPGAASRTYTHSGLEPDTEYCYRTRARNSLGWGRWQWGPKQCFRTEKLSPGAPTTITVQEKDDATGIELSWDEPDTRGLTLSAYHVGISSNAEHWYVFRDGVPATQQTATYSYQFIRKYPHFAGAGSDIRAYFRVRAKATNGELGDWSEASDILIPPG